MLELWGIASYYLGSYLGTSSRLVITKVGVDTNRTRINEEGRGGERGGLYSQVGTSLLPKHWKDDSNYLITDSHLERMREDTPTESYRCT